MSEENGETQETQATQATNEAFAPDDLETLKAQLEEEKKAKAAAEVSLAEKDARIAELEASLSEAKQGGEAAAAELAQVKEAHEPSASRGSGTPSAPRRDCRRSEERRP